MTAARLYVVVVTGSECTGKTTLARELAIRFEAPWSGEFAREYLDRKGAVLDASDVEAVGRGQLDGEDVAAAAATRVLFKDTDLISTVIYARHYYGNCPAWIERAARDRMGDLYLLLHPDVPWVADGLQRDRPLERAHLHDLFRHRLDTLGVQVVDITGDWAKRRVDAFASVAHALQSAPARRQSRGVRTDPDPGRTAGLDSSDDSAHR